MEVEVIRNHFHDDKPSEKSTFVHPHHLKHKEVDKLTEHLPHSVEHAASQVRDHGADAVDKIGLGLMTSHTGDSGSAVSVESRASVRERREKSYPKTFADLEETRTGEEIESGESDRDGYESDGMEEHSGGPPRGPHDRNAGRAEGGEEGTRNDHANEESGGHDSDDDEDQGSSSRQRSKPPKVNVRKGTEDEGGFVGNLKNRLFGRRGSSSTSQAKVEEGRNKPNPNLLSAPSPSISRQSSRNQPAYITKTNPTSEPEAMDNSLSITRTMSRPTIRFAEDSSRSSETAPGNAYQRAPGYKPNPALAMFRTTSVASNGESKDERSVSFQEPERRK